MSYFDEYTEKENVKKIPYDDTPIYRGNERRKRQFKAKKDLKFKILYAVVAVLLISNIVCFTLISKWAKKSGIKVVNTYPITVSSSDTELHPAVVANAWNSCVVVGSGGNERYVKDYDSFFSYTLSKGAGVILQINEAENFAYILTCNHVISKYPSEVYIILPSCRSPIKASVVGASSSYDVAVLKINDLSFIEGCEEISFADSERLSFGETVFAIGNPLSGGQGVTSGIVSRNNVMITIDGVKTREVQIDASINPGNSGGGLFNTQGQFVGLVNAKLNSTTSGSVTTNVEGTAYAIPSTLAVNLAYRIIKDKTSPSGVNLGVNFKVSEDHYETFELIDGKLCRCDTVVVSSVSLDSIASGKLKSGDIIESFEFTDIFGTHRIVEMINIYCFEDYKSIIMANSTVTFNIRRTNIFEIEEETLQVEVKASKSSIYR